MTLPLLRPCPFCGNQPDSANPDVFQLVDGGKRGVVVCCIQGPEVRTNYKPSPDWHQAAAEAWNKRAEQLPEVVQAAARYELLRTLSAREFTVLYKENLIAGVPFDTLVDRRIAERARKRAAGR